MKLTTSYLFNFEFQLIKRTQRLKFSKVVKHEVLDTESH